MPPCSFINGKLLHYKIMYLLCVPRLFEGIEGMSIFEGQSHFAGSLRLKVYPSMRGYGVKSLFISWRGVWD